MVIQSSAVRSISDGAAASALVEGSVFDLSLAPADPNDRRDSAGFFDLNYACIGYKVVERAAMGCQHPKVSKAETPNRKRRDKVSKQSRSWVEQLARFGNKLDPPDLHTQRLTFECPEVNEKQ